MTKKELEVEMTQLAAAHAYRIKKQLQGMVKFPLKTLTEYGLYVAVKNGTAQSWESLHDLMDPNSLGDPRIVYDSMKEYDTHVRYKNLNEDEAYVQSVLDVFNQAQTEVDKWLKGKQLTIHSAVRTK